MLGADLGGQYLLMLPLLLSGRGARAYLHGVAYMHLDARFRPLGPKRLLLCRTPPHVLPSPALMLTQGLDPREADQAPCELEFYARIRRLFAERPCLVTYSLRYLEALDAIGLRTFRNTSIFTGLEHIVDVRQAVDAARLLAGESSGPHDLLGTARRAGFAAAVSRGDHAGRLDALAFLLTAMVRRQPQLMAFCHTALSAQAAWLDAACRSGECCLYLQGTHVQLCLCLGFAHERMNLRVLTCGSELQVLHLALHRRPLLCPEQVLTTTRQRRLGLDLEAARARLTRAAAGSTGLPQRDQGFFEDALHLLSAADGDFYRRFAERDPRSLMETPLCLSHELRLRHLLFKGDNLPAVMTDAEQDRYRRCCAALIEAQLPAYARAVARLREHPASGDARFSSCLQALADYPAALNQPGSWLRAQR